LPHGEVRKLFKLDANYPALPPSPAYRGVDKWTLRGDRCDPRYLECTLAIPGACAGLARPGLHDEELILRQDNSVAILFGVDGEPVSQKVNECLVVGGAESAADSNASHLGIVDSDGS